MDSDVTGLLINQINEIKRIPEDLRKFKPQKINSETYTIALSAERLLKRVSFYFKQIAKSEEEFRLISEKAIDGILTVDEEFTIVFLNKAVESIFGYEDGTLLNHSLLKLFVLNDHAMLFQKLFELKSEKGGGFRFEITGLKSDQEEVALEISLSVNHYRNYATYSCIIRDITTRKKLENQLKDYTENLEKLIEERTTELYQQNIELDQANQKLKKLDQLKSSFLSNVSHELRTPLTSIKSSAKIVLKYGEKKPEAIKKFSNIIIEEAERLTRLINNVLDLSKIEAGEMQFSKQSINLDHLIEHIFILTQNHISEKKLEYLLHLPENIPELYIDRDALIQVLLNLINNSVKFTQKGFIKLDISISTNRTQVTIVVEDSGVGIPEDELEHVFEKFKQSGNSLTDKPKGTGLGLPISREIVQQHGGVIWAESEQNQGSRFIFTLPTVLSKQVLNEIEPKGILYLQEGDLYSGDLAESLIIVHYLADIIFLCEQEHLNCIFISSVHQRIISELSRRFPECTITLFT